MQGRKPKSKQELKAKGTFEKCKQGDRVTLTPIEGIPPAPADFNKEAVNWWNHFCGDIQKASFLAEQHLNAVRLMSLLMVDRVALDKQLKKEGFTFTTEAGMMKQNPAFSLRKQIDDQLIRLFEQFGFTLRSGMTIKAPEKTKTSRILELINGGKSKTA